MQREILPQQGYRCRTKILLQSLRQQEMPLRRQTHKTKVTLHNWHKSPLSPKGKVLNCEISINYWITGQINTRDKLTIRRCWNKSQAH